MGTAKKVTLEDAWDIVTELAISQEETDRQLKENDRQLKGLGKSQEETGRQIKGLGKSQEETGRQIKGLGKSQEETALQLKGLRKSQEETGRQIKGLGKSQEETDRQLKENGRQIKGLRKSQEETARQLKETALQLKETDSRFNSQWGKLVESLVEGNIAQKFADRGVQVQGTTQRAKKTFEDKQYEFDIVVHNGDEIIVVEVKTTLDVGKVKHFLEKLKCFKKVFPEYANKKVYGAVAFIVADSGSDQYSENQKIFVIKATGDSASIINSQNFKPRDF